MISMAHHGTLWVTALFVAAPLLAAACSSEADGDDGEGAGGAHAIPVSGGTCPPKLVNYGAGPGIPCAEDPGDTCADDDHFCVCGESGIEGSGWYCVPTEAGCPATPPADGSACGEALACDYVESLERLRCICDASSWQCESVQAFCPIWGPKDGAACAGFEGETCTSLRPAFSDDGQAYHIPCACGADGTFDCALP